MPTDVPTWSLCQEAKQSCPAPLALLALGTVATAKAPESWEQGWLWGYLGLKDILSVLLEFLVWELPVISAQLVCGVPLRMSVSKGNDCITAAIRRCEMVPVSRKQGGLGVFCNS